MDQVPREKPVMHRVKVEDTSHGGYTLSLPKDLTDSLGWSPGTSVSIEVLPPHDWCDDLDADYGKQKSLILRCLKKSDPLLVNRSADE